MTEYCSRREYFEPIHQPWSVGFDGRHSCECPKVCHHLKDGKGSKLLLPSLLTGSWTWNTRFAGIGGVTLSQSPILGTGLVCSVEDKFKLGLSDIEELSATDSGSELVMRDDFKFWQDVTVDFTFVSEEVNSEEDNSAEDNWKSCLRHWKNVSVFRWSRNSWEL